MTVALLGIGDGRHDYHARALASALEHLPRFDQHLWIDDAQHQLGFAGAIQAGWEQVKTDHVFHLELDFTFNRPVDVDGMIALLERQPHLAQVALKRQAWNHSESVAGGIVEANPDDYFDRIDDRARWTEHRAFFTTNPSVYSSKLCRLGWPQEPHSEGIFTHRLLRDPLLRFAYWGGKFDAPTVTHIGHHRAGTGH